MKIKWFALLAGLFALMSASTAEALPKNFRNVDVFYIGAMPSVEDMDELSTLGVTTVISLHRLPEDSEERAEELGLEIHTFPLRTRLLKIEEIMSVVESSPSASVYIHCMHGADRTGAVAAYWLHTRLGYDPIIALAMVISPSNYHLRGLNMLMREYWMTPAPFEEETLGRYSGARNGGLEGLKVRGNEWYTRLARNYLELTIGPPIDEPKESFWTK